MMWIDMELLSVNKKWPKLNLKWLCLYECILALKETSPSTGLSILNRTLLQCTCVQQNDDQCKLCITIRKKN